MPFTRISLRNGRSADYLQAVSDALHEALVEAFEVPEDDRFQVIEQLEPEAFVYDRHYLARHGRSGNQVLFQITAGRERSDSTRVAFYACLLEKLQQAVGLHADDLMVIITTNRLAEWSFSAGKPATAMTLSAKTEIEEP
ncbi:tautomerase family protein [Marinobacterium arenosum]|uniref:tautomerase family protein n=1 Tax=Marinobacterium arenosum TaxID=2862496 RepID=UPI001C93E8BE|nr:tautomerase family protein [Marinobacterium arenosum]MBY4679125.1 tautomerase family protein [Marinobacterium arenosum]